MEKEQRHGIYLSMLALTLQIDVIYMCHFVHYIFNEEIYRFTIILNHT